MKDTIRSGRRKMPRPESNQTAAALHDSEKRLRAILETAVEGIITIDERGIVESLNPAAERIFGYKAAEVIGQNVSILMPSPYREEHDRYMGNYLRTGHAKIIGIGREAVGQRKDGSVFPLDLAVSEVKLANRRLFTGFVRDITERSRLEKEVLEISEREQRRMGQDLHDGLGQQLTAIELMCESLRSDLAGQASSSAGSRGVLARELEAQAAQLCRFIRETIRQTRSLAHGLAPFKVEAGGLEAALKELAQNTSSLGRAKVYFSCATPVSLPDNEAAAHLYRIAQEAVNNAVKHSQASEVTICLSQRDGGLSLEVRDNGKGLGEGKQRQGMGIHVMKHRAGVLGGKLEVRSKPGKGVTVTCTLQGSQ